MGLFEFQGKEAGTAGQPLADRMRPKTLDDVMGQDHAVGPGSLIRAAIEKDRIFSMILWGPPGCGKTTLARILAGETHSHFVEFSAVLSGVKEIRAVIDVAKSQLQLHRKKTILFVDEIHRFNKAQQDAFLHHVENGLITLIGATAENPSFEVIPALMSRCRLITLKPLGREDIVSLLQRALTDQDLGLGKLNLGMETEALDFLGDLADGDARFALNTLEVAAYVLARESRGKDRESRRIMTLTEMESALEKRALLYDKGGEEHFNLISALHKSLRGSDPDGALYWLERMLSGGDDPLYIGRRMVRFASEDIGNADPNALTVVMNAVEAFRFLGQPEGELALYQACAYLATAPKSNSLYAASHGLKDAIQKTGSLPVPLHIRNAPTKLMKEIGYGKGYEYAHDHKDALTPQEYLPDLLKGTEFYRPTTRGYEKVIKERLDKWKDLKRKLKKE
ncbi:MAG: replication-associated recombination protein A [Desulfobacteraceae bacterium]|nr:replication-associated recombination protein A [Desulfobacteraceae bacterium]